MKRCLPIVVALLAGLPLEAEAHRLDEYLQATRVALTPDGLEIELDLTPGAAVADSVFPLIDRDRDLRVTPPEIEAYARLVLTDLALQVDGRGYPLSLTRAECPSWPEIRDGMGTITIVATADAPWRRGSHHVRYENFHRRDISVFLANALVPAAREISIVAQERDPGQQRFDLDISVAPAWSRYVWPALPSILLTALIVVRRRQP
jgi:hypothetical protein